MNNFGKLSGSSREILKTLWKYLEKNFRKFSVNLSRKKSSYENFEYINSKLVVFITRPKF